MNWHNTSLLYRLNIHTQATTPDWKVRWPMLYPLWWSGNTWAHTHGMPQVRHWTDKLFQHIREAQLQISCWTKSSSQEAVHATGGMHSMQWSDSWANPTSTPACSSLLHQTFPSASSLPASHRPWPTIKLHLGFTLTWEYHDDHSNSPQSWLASWKRPEGPPNCGVRGIVPQDQDMGKREGFQETKSCSTACRWLAQNMNEHRKCLSSS